MTAGKVVERKLLFKRVFPKTVLYEIGWKLNIPYFRAFTSPWEIEKDEAAFELAQAVADHEIEDIFYTFKPREWAVFRGKHYTFEDNTLLQTGYFNTVSAGIEEARRKHGETCDAVLAVLVEAEESCNLEAFRGSLGSDVDPLPILNMLVTLKVVSISYEGLEYREWKILEETLPMVRTVLKSKTLASSKAHVVGDGVKPEYVKEEYKLVSGMNREFNEYLRELISNRYDQTVRFGKSLSITSLAAYFRELFGEILYFDSLLGIVQQYGLADVEIVHPQGYTGKKTGWNLSLFGEPGTGKSFATRDMILGKRDAKVPPHGIPGRNRYVGGITPARFIRVGQVYVDKIFNFIVPEFNDWFKYRGMVEPLKLALERGKIKLETHREIVGPYSFTSFFTVNYNVATFGRGYEVTVKDPNFNAIEDRMLCRLHQLTKQRYLEIAKSQMKLVYGEIDIDKGAQNIRDHLTLVYAAEAKHPLLGGRLRCKPVLITPETQEKIEKARNTILKHIPDEVVRFSARLEDHAIRFACAASLLNYFHSDSQVIPVSEDALNNAVRLFVEEASARSREEFDPQEVLGELTV